VTRSSTVSSSSNSPASTLLAQAVMLPVLTATTYDSFPEQVDVGATPLLCPAGQFVVGVMYYTTSSCHAM
jgi:hypothetical protein